MIDLLSLGYVGVFLLSFALNMIPFMGPSNIVIAGAIAFALPWANPLLIGLLVASASSSAKLIHFYTAFFIGKSLSSERRGKLEKYSGKSTKIKPFLLFIAAVSPIPDEPIVIPLGLLKYNPLKFFVIFLVGKMIIAVPGAYFGSRISLTFSTLINNPLLIVVSAVLTIIITYVLIKIDLENALAQLLKL